MIFPYMLICVVRVLRDPNGTAMVNLPLPLRLPVSASEPWPWLDFLNPNYQPNPGTLAEIPFRAYNSRQKTAQCLSIY